LAAGNEIKDKMATRCQIFTYPFESDLQFRSRQYVVQSIEVRGDQIDLARQMQRANILLQKTNG
jgi:hypothetical protein